MDFGTLLHVAKKNSETSKNESKYYSTKFAPPKKVSKEKKLSDNIQKFLQKREQEERERKLEHKQKVDALMAQRDQKSKNKISKMLKVTKSANKSVLEDADYEKQMAISMKSSDQPDQDDYGYVSTEANVFYAKYIEKVKDVQEDKGFAPSRPQSLHDLTGTKARVKAAITREIEEKKTHTRQRTSTVTSSNSPSSSSKDPTVVRQYSTSSASLYDPEAERREDERKKKEEAIKKAKARRPAPPPMDFQALLKLAEKKQHEPVAILKPETKTKKEPERLLTLKEKKEADERQRWKDERAKRDRERSEALKKKDSSAGSSANASIRKMEPNGRIPKLNQATKTAAPGVSSASTQSVSSTSQSGGNGFKKPQSNTSASSTAAKIAPNVKSSSASVSSSSQRKPQSASTSQKKTQSASSTKSSSAKSSSASTSALPSSNSISKNPYGATGKQVSYNGPTREFPPRDIKSGKSPLDVQKTRQFPPADVRRGGPPSRSQVGNRRPQVDNSRPQPQSNKRRFYDDDESEYDSELDDFIDDGDCGEDYSAHIKSIFGYDKSRYRDLDDEDDAAMESNYAQQQREEFLSKKAGLREDLEDMELEAMEKKRKLKKRRLLSDD